MATVVNSTSIEVSWTIPLCPNGIITHYILYYRQTDTRQTSNINTTGYSMVAIPSSLTKHTITNLEVSQVYGFIVQAIANNVSGAFAIEELSKNSARPCKIIVYGTTMYFEAVSNFYLYCLQFQ